MRNMFLSIGYFNKNRKWCQWIFCKKYNFVIKIFQNIIKIAKNMLKYEIKYILNFILAYSKVMLLCDKHSSCELMRLFDSIKVPYKILSDDT